MQPENAPRPTLLPKRPDVDEIENAREGDDEITPHDPGLTPKPLPTIQGLTLREATYLREAHRAIMSLDGPAWQGNPDMKDLAESVAHKLDAWVRALRNAES